MMLSVVCVAGCMGAIKPRPALLCAYLLGVSLLVILQLSLGAIVIAQYCASLAQAAPPASSQPTATSSSSCMSDFFDGIGVAASVTVLLLIPLLVCVNLVFACIVRRETRKGGGLDSRAERDRSLCEQTQQQTTRLRNAHEVTDCE